MAKRKPARTRKQAPTRRPAAAGPRRAARKAAPARRAAVSRTAASKPAARKTARKAVRKATRKVATKAVRKVASKVVAKAVLKKAAAKKAVKQPLKKAAKKAAKQAVKKPATAAAPKRPVARTAPSVQRARRTWNEEAVPGPPSSLDLDRTASAARSGRRGMLERYEQHTETGPTLTGGDIDADWESAYSVGDEAPGGDNPTPDQDLVDDIGKAVGIVYEDNEELQGEEKVIERDRHRWELDPASSDDFEDR